MKSSHMHLNELFFYLALKTDKTTTKTCTCKLYRGNVDKKLQVVTCSQE